MGGYDPFYGGWGNPYSMGYGSGFGYGNPYAWNGGWGNGWNNPYGYTNWGNNNIELRWMDRLRLQRQLHEHHWDARERPS